MDVDEKCYFLTVSLPRAVYPLSEGQCKHHVFKFFTFCMLNQQTPAPERDTRARCVLLEIGVPNASFSYQNKSEACLSYNTKQCSQAAGYHRWQAGGPRTLCCYYYFVFGCLNYEEKTFYPVTSGLINPKENKSSKPSSCLGYLAREILQINDRIWWKTANNHHTLMINSGKFFLRYTKWIILEFKCFNIAV